MSTSFKPAAKALCPLAVLAATLLTACGNSSSDGSSSTRSATASGDQSAAKEPAAYARAHGSVTAGVVTHRALPGSGGATLNDDNPRQAGTHPKAGRDPCTLVSKAQAQAILGRAISNPVEAPLGPTCIYQPAGTKSLVTVTVASVNFATIRRHLRDRKRIDVNGHTAYCGTYGQVATFVLLAHGRVLNVTAPCAIGTRFAAQALLHGLKG
jgi:hypothetical protein